MLRTALGARLRGSPARRIRASGWGGPPTFTARRQMSAGLPGQSHLLIGSPFHLPRVRVQVLDSTTITTRRSHRQGPTHARASTQLSPVWSASAFIGRTATLRVHGPERPIFNGPPQRSAWSLLAHGLHPNCNLAGPGSQLVLPAQRGPFVRRLIWWAGHHIPFGRPDSDMGSSTHPIPPTL